MSKIKVIVSMLAVVLMVFALAACTPKDDSNGDGSIPEGQEGMAYREVEDAAGGQIASPGEENQMQTISGTITDASMHTITIETDDGASLTFSTEDADTSGADGLETGSTATIIYSGDIDGTDTSGVTVNVVTQP